MKKELTTNVDRYGLGYLKALADLENEINKGCGNSLSANMFNFKYCGIGNLCNSCKINKYKLQELKKKNG